MDPGAHEAIDRLGVDLRGEIRSTEAEGRVYVDGRIQASAAETRSYIGELIQTSEAETRAYIDEKIQTSTASLLHQMRQSESGTRRHFDVVGESLRGDIRGVAELVERSSEGSKRRDDEQAERTDGLEGRVLRLEVRASSPEDDRKPRLPRRRR